MKYISTRGNAPAIGFDGVLLSGPAPDGGLYMPETWPTLDMRRLRGRPGLDYATLAASVIASFAGAPEWYAAIDRTAHEAYAKFSDSRIAPLRETGPHRWIMELFHGPTLAFKDFALQVLGPLMNEALARRRARALVVAATSGDTGAAAVRALAGLEHLDLVVLHPKGRISDVQRRQMTTIGAANVRNIAIHGTFDDAQALVKQLFADHAFASRHSLAAINSINWVRIAAQAAYYVAACLALGRPVLHFSVPTGNFGDAFAGYVARRMGAPVGRLLVATNANDILVRAISTGTCTKAPVHATQSPAMDIQVASNFERMLFECTGRDPVALRALMEAFETTGTMTIPPGVLAALRAVLAANRVLEAETAATMKIFHDRAGILVDPHTAVGLTATRILPEADDVVTLATAHPAKFPDAVAAATGVTPSLPPHLQPIMTAAEHYDELEADIGALRAYIEALRLPVASA